MGTNTRPQLSYRNRYWVEKHRYYELKHFCLQYPLWKKALAALDGLNKPTTELVMTSRTNVVADPTAQCAERRAFYTERIELVERIAAEASPEFQKYILKAVIEGLSYEYLNAQIRVPCSRDTYYDLYRRFFWLLDRARG